MHTEMMDLLRGTFYEMQILMPEKNCDDYSCNPQVCLYSHWCYMSTQYDFNKETSEHHR